MKPEVTEYRQLSSVHSAKEHCLVRVHCTLVNSIFAPFIQSVWISVVSPDYLLQSNFHMIFSPSSFHSRQIRFYSIHTKCLCDFLPSDFHRLFRMSFIHSGSVFTPYSLKVMSTIQKRKPIYTIILWFNRNCITCVIYMTTLSEQSECLIQVTAYTGLNVFVFHFMI